MELRLDDPFLTDKLTCVELKVTGMYNQVPSTSHLPVHDLAEFIV